MGVLSEVAECVIRSYNGCCQTICQFGKERKKLTCGTSAFSNEILTKKDVEFVLPLKPAYVLQESPVQRMSSTLPSGQAISPNWRDGLANPEETLRYLVTQHRNESCYSSLLTSSSKRASKSAGDLLKKDMNENFSNPRAFRKSISYCDARCDKNQIAAYYGYQREATCQSFKYSMINIQHSNVLLNCQNLDSSMNSVEMQNAAPVCLVSQESQGRLNFSVAYDVENMCLTVCILEAKLLPQHNPTKDVGISSNLTRLYKLIKNNKKKKEIPDSCVFMRLYKSDGSILEQSTKTCKSTLKPSYCASYCFSMKNADLDRVKMEMILFECDKYVKKKEIGSVKLNVSDISHLLRQNKMVEMWRDILRDDKELAKEGKVELSICYRPDQEALKLGVATVKTNRSWPRNGKIYVKFTLMSDEKVLSVHQTGYYMPSFEYTILNEIYSIPIKKRELERAVLVVALYIRDPDSDVNIEIGRCCVGSITYTNDRGLAHWNDAILYSGCSMLRTHSLY